MMMNRKRKRGRSRDNSPLRGLGAIGEMLEARRLMAVTPITFAGAVSFVAGTAPVALVAGDFNADGKIDLAVADATTKKVDLFFGNGNGTFAAGPQLSLSGVPTAILTADFNGDGKPDLAVACTAAFGQTTTTVDVFLNSGAGTFNAAQVTTVETGAVTGEPIAIAAADFNRDGKTDLALTEYTAQQIDILPGNGNGAFANSTAYPGNAYPTSITAADFNADGFTDLAISSTTVNFFGGATVGSGSTSQVSLFLNNANGIFAGVSNTTISTAGVPHSVAVANFSGAASPGLLVSNTDGTVTVLVNSGGTLSESATATTAGGSSAVATGDFNLDGNTDFVSANGGGSQNANSVTVVPGVGSGTLSAAQTIATGAAPLDVVVADFNGDGLPDIATANEADGTISILSNTTLLPQIATQVAVTSSSFSAPAGATVTFSATLKATSVNPLPGESLPTGTVNFYEGATLLGSSTIASGATIAAFSTPNLTVGNHLISVIYTGDPAYLASTSARITEVITPTATEGPDLIGTIVSATLPATVAPGETGIVRVLVTNQGNSAAIGSIFNTVYLSLDNTLDNGDTPVTVRGSLAHAGVHLLPGKSITLVGTVTIPQNVPIASYSLLVQLDSTGSLAESVATNDTVTSPGLFNVADVFGTVAGRRRIVLQTTDNNGTSAVFRLTGPGNGTVNTSDSGVHVLLDGTTTASVLTITAPVGAAPFVVSELSADSPIGTIRAPRLNVTGSLGLPGGASAVTIAGAGGGGINNALISIGAGVATALNLGRVYGANLTASGGIRSLVVTDWTAGSINANWISTLHSAQQFAAGISLTGIGAPRGVSLASATIGAICSGSWVITGNIGRIALADTPAAANGWSLNDNGSLKSLALGSSFYGSIFAVSIGSVQIRGDFVDGEIGSNTNLSSIAITGNLTDAKVLAATTSAGTLGSIRVTGAVSGSLVGAGVGTDSLNAIVLSAEGVLRSVTIFGAVDSSSKFLAAVLPKRAVLAGVRVDPGVDSHFHQ